MSKPKDVPQPEENDREVQTPEQRLGDIALGKLTNEQDEFPEPNASTW